MSSRASLQALSIAFIAVAAAHRPTINETIIELKIAVNTTISVHLLSVILFINCQNSLYFQCKHDIIERGKGVNTMDFDFQGLVNVLASPIISALTALTVNWLTGRTNRKMKIDQIRMQRIEKLYAPFYKRCLQCFFPESTLWNRRSIAGEFQVLFSENIIYMSQQSQKLFKDYYAAFRDRFVSDSVSEQDKQHYEECFIQLAKSLQRDHKLLSRKLKLEPPLELF